MKKTTQHILAIVLLPGLLAGCKGSQYSHKKKHEVTVLNVQKTKPIDLLAFQSIEELHNSTEVASSRAAFLGAYGSTAIGMAMTGVKALIKHEQEKYHDEYDFELIPQGHRIQNDSSYFYKGISDIAFNPSDMQFNGFTIVRMSGKDTAMRAVFEVDKSNLCEIFYDGIFRLKLKEFEFNYSKAKVSAKGVHGAPRLNLDFTIDFTSSFISNDGRLNTDVPIGKFTLNLAGVCLHNADSCKKYIGRKLEGYSFLAPRSYGYSVQAVRPIYSQGAFSIRVNVKEVANRKMVGKLMTQYQDQIFASMDKRPQ